MSVLITIVALVASAVLVAPVAGASTHVRRHMPDLIGLTRPQVYAVMHRDALYFVTTGPGSSNGTWKEAVGQSPKPGTVVPWHFQATVRTSLANPHGLRRVPRLIGLSRARTYAVMRQAQLFFTTRGPGSSDGKWIVVLRQSPRAGTRVRWHATVALTVSTRRPVRRPVTTTTLKPKPTCTPVTTTAPPTTAATTTTTITGETTTTVAPTTTTTICRRPVTTTTVRRKKRSLDYRVGDATWYRYIPGHCATWYLPRGTRIAVRDLATGKVIHCIASDREGAHGNRVVDLDSRQFAELAPLSRGVIVVKVSW